jgi:hypothetical protein
MFQVPSPTWEANKQLNKSSHVNSILYIAGLKSKASTAYVQVSLAGKSLYIYIYMSVFGIVMSLMAAPWRNKTTTWSLHMLHRTRNSHGNRITALDIAVSALHQTIGFWFQHRASGLDLDYILL